jgi:hypothetical protein
VLAYLDGGRLVGIASLDGGMSVDVAREMVVAGTLTRF